MPRPKRQTRYEMLADEMSAAITNGRIPPGFSLPSVRECAKQRGYSINTVLSAYRLMEDKGLVKSAPQSGFYVCSRLAELEHPFQNEPGTENSKTETDLMAILLEAQDKPDVLDIAFAAPKGKRFFPERSLSLLTRQVLNENSTFLATYALPPGSELLREQIARRAMLLGMSIASADVTLTHGATEALHLALRAVVRSGDKVAIEMPTYFNLYPLLESLGITAVEIATHPKTGIVLEALEKVLAREKIAAIVTMPTVHNPLGCTMPVENKSRLAKMAALHRTPVIEDTVYAELQFDQPLQPAVKAFDEDGWVMVCGGFSKTLAPDYRLGWIQGGRFTPEVKRLKFSSSASESRLLSETVGRYMASGGYDRHLRSLRRMYQAHIEIVRGVIADHFPPGTRATQPKGGFVLWVELPETVDTTVIFHLALSKNLVFMPGVLYSDGSKFTNCLRIACCQEMDERYLNAIMSIGSLASEYTRRDTSLR